MTAVAAGLAAVSWLPVLRAAPSPDEAGFLMVAAQWQPGTSVYGDYWVDRPPLLIWLFGLADGAGGLTALRLLGILAVVLSVLAGGYVGRLASDGSAVAAGAAAIAVAVFTASPLCGAGFVNGEILALPFVLLGLALLLRARREPTARRAAVLWAGAGAAATAAALVKQNVLDVVVVAGVLLACAPRRARRRTAAASFAVGLLVAAVAAVGYAGTRGTSVADLWDVVVAFRIEATGVIGSSASAATPMRAARLALVFVACGMVPVLVTAWRRLGGRGTAVGRDLRLAAGALLAWELFAVVLGGSYWIHYLIGVVPGLALAVALAVGGEVRLPRSLGATLGFSAVATAVVVAWVSVFPPFTVSPVSSYLRAHGEPGDTAIVAYGEPDILYEAGMGSPYPWLWSLPVRVRDQRLDQLGAILDSDRRPTWIVTGPAGLASWGLDPSRATGARLAARYRPVAELDGKTVLLRLDRWQEVTADDHGGR